MWVAGTQSDGMCYHKHTLPSLPEVLHIPSVVTHITPFHKGNVTILPSLAIFPSSTTPIHCKSCTAHITVGKHFKSTSFCAPALVITANTSIITELTDILSAYDFHKYKFPVCTF